MSIYYCLDLDECNKNLSGNLNRHYKRIHPDKQLPNLPRLSPTVIPPDTPEVKKALSLIGGNLSHMHLKN